MSSEKPNFLSQPVVKNVFMYRNGDPYFEARRIVINQKRVSNFETLLREVTGGIQAPFGAVRNIYTPRGGHKVDSLETLQSGEQYVAAGRERFKRLDYLHIGSRKKRMMQTLPMQVKPLPPNRIIVSARFLKPIKEPCTVFVVANGDVLNPAMRLLIHQRMLSQFDKILEMITEKMGLRVLGGVRSLYTYEGQQVTDGHQMESGQLYVAVGREKFKKLPYSDLLFTKPRGTRRINGMKAFSLPPIHRFSKQNGNAKSTVRCSDSGEGDSKAFPPANTSNNKEHLSSIVREISQARLISLRKKRSGQSMTLSITDNDELEAKADDGNSEDNPPQEQPAEEKPADDETKAAEEKGEKEGEGKMEAADKNTSEETSGDEEKKNEDTSVEKEKEATVGAEEKKVEEEIKKEVRDEGKEEVKSEEQGSSSSNGDTTLESKEKEDEGHEGEKLEHDTNIKEEGQDKESEQREESSKDQVNDVDTGEEEKETENSSDPEKTQSDNDTKENRKERGSSGNSNQDEDASTTKEGATKELGEEEKMVNGEISGEDDEVESEAELDLEEKKTASGKEGMENTAKEQKDKKENKIQSSKDKE